LDKARLDLESEARSGLADSVLVKEKPVEADQLSKLALDTPCELGPYEVKGLIARGGMGEVYEARHKRLDRPVALKVIRGFRLDDPGIHENFIREMSNAGKLDHPNLVRAYDAWESDGCLYLAFELLDGKSLQQVFTSEVKPCLVDVLHYLLGICSGLNRLHQQNLIHFDLKPSNVMLLPDGTIKLIDIGLAKSHGPVQSSHVPGTGTFGYIAPEAEDPNGTIDQRSDLFSLGRLLEFMLNSQKHKKSSSDEEKLHQALRKIVSKLTQPLAIDRYQNVRQVIGDLNLIALSPSSLQKRFASKMVILPVLAGVLLSVWAIASGFFTGKAISLPAFRPNQGEAYPPIPMRFATLPIGSFMMGAVEGDPDAKPDEHPNRIVEFTSPIRIGVTEVTVGQFREFVAFTGYRTEAELSGKGGWKAGLATSWSNQKSDFYWNNPGYPVSDDLPVTMVTYHDVSEFCDWLSRRNSRRYRLPTEAEWEYACRAGSKDIYPFPIQSRDSFAWSSFNIKTSLSPRPVGTRNANPWGLVDTMGNVREWCLDWYGEKSYQTPHQNAPSGPSSGNLRVIRGACFIDKAEFMRASKRGYLSPDQAINNQGFRLVQE
jgi:formylglycine-generating enzyme required for sulfatase activity